MARISVLLPEPEFPTQQHALARRHLDVGVVDHHPAVAMHDRKVGDLDVLGASVLHHDGRGARRVVVHLLERVVQLLHATGGG